MDDVAADREALGEAVVFLRYFADLADPRQPGKVTYPLDEVLLLSLLGVLAGAESFVDIARFGAKKLALLRRFRPFCDGTPPACAGAGLITITSAISSPPWTPSNSSAASSPGWPR